MAVSFRCLKISDRRLIDHSPVPDFPSRAGTRQSTVAEFSMTCRSLLPTVGHSLLTRHCRAMYPSPARTHGRMRHRSRLSSGHASLTVDQSTRVFDAKMQPEIRSTLRPAVAVQPPAQKSVHPRAAAQSAPRATLPNGLAALADPVAPHTCTRPAEPAGKPPFTLAPARLRARSVTNFAAAIPSLRHSGRMPDPASLANSGQSSTHGCPVTRT
jgi:hypothetical protein